MTIRPTLTLPKMASTQGGMRRMLKKQLSPVDYIRSAVRAGVYPDENNNNNRNNTGYRGGRNNQNIPPHLRREPRPEQYPVEYMILSMNPPIPTPPRVTQKDIKRLRESSTIYQNYKNSRKGASRKVPSAQKLIKNYLRRYDARTRTSVQVTPEEKENQYYREILGVKDSSMNQDDDDEYGKGSAMGRKSVVLNRAYDFALRQYQILKENDGQMDEEESIKIVEELLAKESKEEKINVRKNREEVRNWRKQQKQTQKQMKGETDGLQEEAEKEEVATKLTTSKSTSTDTKSSQTHNTLPSILSHKPRTIKAMHIWGQRLQAVPYKRWTIGAATALDHWIAVDVLGMSEDTWNRILEGELESDAEAADGPDSYTHTGNLATARDIIDVRGSLFPETVISSILQHEDDIDDEEEEATEEDMRDLLGLSKEEEVDKQNTTPSSDENDLEIAERSIDELLASLGGFDDDADSKSKDSGSNANENTTSLFGEWNDPDMNIDDRVSSMMDTLQEWRAKNEESPFENWDMDTKKEFNDWVKEYIALVTTESDGEVDIPATRKALLSEPPISRDASDSFWSRVKDETEAEIFLQELLSIGMPTMTSTANNKENDKAMEAFQTFLALPYERQLAKLINMGTLRPILDEYTKESKRVEFVSKYAEALMEGVEVEHLVPDKHGPITVKDLEGTSLNDIISDSMKIDLRTRFKVVMIPYGTDDFGKTRSERARILYRAWNLQRAGRSRYEEHLFKKRVIGLEDKSTK